MSASPMAGWGGARAPRCASSRPPPVTFRMASPRGRFWSGCGADSAEICRVLGASEPPAYLQVDIFVVLLADRVGRSRFGGLDLLQNPIGNRSLAIAHGRIDQVPGLC